MKTLSQIAMLFSFVLLFVFGMNYSAVDFSGTGLSRAFNLSAWASFSVLSFLGVLFISFSGRLKVSHYMKMNLLVVLLLLLPLTYNPVPLNIEGLIVVAAVFASLYFFILVSQHTESNFKLKALFIIYLSTLIQTGWGLAQYYLIFENSPLFFNAEDSVIPYGVFGQQNVLTSYISLGTLLSIFFLMRDRHNKILIVLTFAVLIANAHLSMLAEAETGRVIALIAICSYLVFCIFQYKIKVIGVLMILLACVVSFTPKQWFDVRPAQEVTAPIGINSIGLRPQIYKIGSQIIADHPIVGIGIGNLSREFLLRKSESTSKEFAETQMLTINHIHNEPMQWMVDLGVVSGLAFLLLFVIWVKGIRNKQLDVNILLLALPLVGHAMLERPFHHSAAHLLAFVAILALSYRGPSNKVRLSKTMSTLLAAVAGMISYKVMAFMFILFVSTQNLLAYFDGKRLDESLLYAVEPGPVLEDIYEFERFNWIVRKGIASDNLSYEAINAFIVFLEAGRMKHPEPIIYSQLAQFYEATQQQDKAWDIIEEGRLFYPWDESIAAKHADMLEKRKTSYQ